MAKRVLSILLNDFRYDSRVLKECQSLQAAGYEVQVVAMHAEDLAEREVIGGVPVHRIPLKSRRWSKHRLVQLLKFGEYIYRVIRTYRKWDVFHCNDVEPLPIGVLIKWFFNRRAKVVYDAHELEFEKAEANSGYFPQWTTALAERLFIRSADAVLTVSPLIADEYEKRYGIRPEIVMNCPNYEEAGPSEDLFRKAFKIRPEQTIFLYQGGLIPKRGVEELIETFQELDDRYVLVFLGFGALVPLAEAAAAEHANIFFHPAVSPLELSRYTRSADVGFCLYQGHTRNHQLTIGNKIFQYIMAGIPILASNLDGLRYVLKDGMGLVIEDFRNTEKIKESVREIEQWKPEDYQAVLAEGAQTYSWEAQEEVLIRNYHKVAPAT
jgi:glycosyltransferase involved in cell wall biosynthesis